VLLLKLQHNRNYVAREERGYMTDKELRRLSRSDLLEMLLAQVEENQKLKVQLNGLQDQLDNRRIVIDKAGSIAEAALQLNGVFEAAQNAAAQYLENIQQLSREEDAVCRRMEKEARERAEAICAEADEYSRRVRLRADQYQRQVVNKIQDLLRDKSRLHSLLRYLEEEQESEKEKNS